jgi:hypothetical protein
VVLRDDLGIGDIWVQFQIDIGIKIAGQTRVSLQRRNEGLSVFSVSPELWDAMLQKMRFETAFEVFQVGVDAPILLGVKIWWQRVDDNRFLGACLLRVGTPFQLPHGEIVFERVDLLFDKVGVQCEICLCVKVQRQPRRLESPESTKGSEQATEEGRLRRCRHEGSEKISMGQTVAEASSLQLGVVSRVRVGHLSSVMHWLQEQDALSVG